jgi:ribose transport system substrate-binding protein
MHTTSRPALPVAAACLLALAACSSTTTTGAGDGTVEDWKNARIEVLQPGVHPYIAANNEGLEAAADELGLTKMNITQSNYDPAQEVSNINNALARGADGLIVQPASSTGVIPSLKQAFDKNLCVVALTTGPGESTQELYPGLKGFVGWDEFNNGEWMGRAMAEGMGGTGNVVIVQGVLDNNAARDRQAGAEAVWEAEFPDINVLDVQAADFDSAKARAVTQNFIQRHGEDIDGILAITNNMATAAADAVYESDLRGEVTIVSTGGQEQFIEYIKDGKAYATTPELPVTEAKEAMNLLVQCLQGDDEPVFVNETELPAVAAFKDDGYAITAENADRFEPEW